MADAIAEIVPPATADSFDLHAAAAEFYDQFPAFAGRVTFVDVASGQIINSDPAKGQKFIDFFSTPEGKEEILPIIQGCVSGKCCHTQFANDGDAAIFMYLRDDRQRYFGDAVSARRELQFVFDHETGHVVVPEGSADDRLTAENAADAFALLRDMARGGDDTLAKAALLFRTGFALLVKSGIVNFSSPMIEDFIQDRGRLAEEGLTPARMVTLAADFANRDTMDAQRVEALQQSLEKLYRHRSLATLKDIALTTPLPDTFKWTSTILKAVLDRRIGMPGSTAEAFDDAVRDLPRLEKREAELIRPPVRPRTAAAAAAPA
jgi:hypothetical protein